MDSYLFIYLIYYVFKMTIIYSCLSTTMPISSYKLINA